MVKKQLVFSHDEALKASIDYFEGDELAATVFVTKYALRGSDGLLELTPKDMHRRLAREFARIEAKYPNPMSEEEIFTLLDKFKYIVPQGSPMSAIGNVDQVQSLSNCFVIKSPNDAYGSITRADEEMIQIMKRRGGVGVDISNIRPRGVSVRNAAKTSDGIGIFMERYSNTTREVAQGARRGALMQTIDVRHPDIETFVKIKNQKDENGKRTKVTGANVSVRVTDEFMRAVENNTEFILRWPVESSIKEAKLTRTIMARDLWKTMMSAAWESAEPGILYWDAVKRLSMSDEFADKGYETISTNPCFHGDTLIATADGRNAVSIKQLAEEGLDVDVYSVNPIDGKVSIKRARNPRVTEYNAKLVRVHLDDGTYLDVTPNHNFVTMNGEKIQAKDLQPGTSLPRFLKRYEPIEQGKRDYLLLHTNTRDMTSKSSRVFEHRFIAKHNQAERWNALYNEQKLHGWIEGGLVVHHKDHDPLNNTPSNLEVMTWAAHARTHAMDFVGDKNPRYIDVSNDELVAHAHILTKRLGYRFSKNDWAKYALENGLPLTLSDYRKNNVGTLTELATQVAHEQGIFHINVDPRLVKTLANMEDQGYEARIEGHHVLVKRTCEWCNAQFEVKHSRRENAFCSVAHANAKINSSQKFHIARTNSTVATYASRAPELRNNQARIWSELRFNLKRNPLLKEWETECVKQDVAKRLKTKFGFQSWKDVTKAGQDYNHKIVRVEELSGEHVVYNLTVDDNHTVAIVTKIDDPATKNAYDGVFVANCGEIPLNAADSCRLLLINLYSYVVNPFTKNASFDYDLFQNHVVKAQRLMDDLVDLELEAVDRIIAKIENDDENLREDNLRELLLWKKIRDVGANGRRTGTGITALGDTLAALGVTYGSEESIKITENIYKNLALNAHASSVSMAKERGPFPAWEPGRYINNEFAQRLITASDSTVNDDFKKYGRRNIALSTTAPAGSVSTLTQTTSGIEPAYLLHYKRRKKLVQTEIENNVTPDFIDALGDKWVEYDVYHHGLKKWMDVSGDTNIENSPYNKATSNDVDWIKSVDLQAAAQYWIEHSISKTINLPKHVTEDLVSEVYMRAWKANLKGVTVYRDGCRDGVLISADEKPKNTTDSMVERHAPKRPKILDCDIQRATVKGEKYLVLVGLMNGKPYELFAGLSDKLEVPKRFEHGKLFKNGKNKDGLSTYNLSIDLGDDDQLLVKDVATMFDNATYATFTRMVSLALRHGTPVQFVCEQMSKSTDEDMQSFAKVVSRVLKKYIPDGAKPASEKKCLNCGSENVAYTEGCISCLSCGSSKCG